MLKTLACIIGFFPVTGNAYCWKAAEERYGVSADLLQAIASVESGLKPDAMNINSDGTRDQGLMQINDWWLPILRQYGVSEEEILEPCINVQIGAWILAHNILRYGPSWYAVGVYNAGTSKDMDIEQRRREYAWKIANTLKRRP